MLNENNNYVNIGLPYRDIITIVNIKPLKTDTQGHTQYKLLLWNDSFIIKAKTEKGNKNSYKFKYFYKNDMAWISYKYDKNGNIIITDIDFYNK